MIDIDSPLENGYTVYRNERLNEIMALADRDDVVNATEGRFSIVQDGPMRNSLDASWHQDGVHFEHPPSRVLLYCVSPGRSDITTDLSNVVNTLNNISDSEKSVLRRLTRFYVSRSGKDIHEGPLITRDAATGADSIGLCSRCWVRADADTTLEQMTRAMFSLFEAFIPVHSHQWQEGDCLIFDNIGHVHRRHNPQNLVDPDRRLIRIWFK